MTAVAERGLQSLPDVARRRAWRKVPRGVWIPSVVALANATAFFLARPGVNDLWAARARASAARHGVGLTYWFSWFGGGSTPGNYSVLTPYLSAYLSAELVGALSAVAITLLIARLVRGMPHATAATAIATAAAGINLWSGRVPFLLGCAFAVAALIAVRYQRPWWAAVATVATILASPVSAAFLALGLAGTLLSPGAYRKISATTMGTVVVGFGVVALAFGTPGPQHFSWVLCIESIAALLAFLVSRPPDGLRVVIYLSILTSVLMLLIPNGMGSNFGRMVWFCIPVAVVALSPRRVWLPLLLVAPVLISGANLTLNDLRQASARTADPAYYTPLAAELDRIPDLSNYRLEVVAQKAHAAYDSLLGHAMLARGWETQEDNHLNPTLSDPHLDATSYYIWLENNSVGYVAIPRSSIETYPEYTLVASGKLGFLTQVWHSSDWSLYRVKNSVPIVPLPRQQVIESGQSHLTIRTTCACQFTVRIRYSKYLHATPIENTTTSDAKATIVDDGYGFTRITTTEPGDYVLRGSVKSLFH